jgi:hypothetical protein
MQKTLRVVLLLLIGVGMVAGLVFAYLKMSKERKVEAAREKPVATKPRASFGTNGEPVVTLDEETQKRIALKVQQVAPGTIIPELKGYGRVLDPAPLAALSAELAAAEAALAASRKEFDRLRVLSEQQNASDRALQGAEAVARRDEIGVESVRLRLVSGWGKAIAERADLADFVRSLVSLESALVRIDLPAGETVGQPPSGARIVAAGGKAPVPAQLLGPAPNADPQMQGEGFLFLVKSGAVRLVPGMAVGGYLELRREPLRGFTVPDAAVVRQGRNGWVYVQTGNDTFARSKIRLDHPREDGWFVTEGVRAGDRVVVGGAQELLSEEQKYQIRMLE